MASTDPISEAAPDLDREKPTVRRAGGRPRSAAARRAVLAAAYTILVEDGLAAFSVDAVAARSGVAKTTIYRSWPSKGLLIFESFFEAYHPQLAFEPGESPADDLRRLVLSLAHVLCGPAGRLTTSVIAEAQADEGVRHLFLKRFSEPLRQRSTGLIEAGIRRGVFRRDLEIPRVIDAFVGATYLRLIFGLTPDAEWASELADTLLQGCVDPAHRGD